MTSSSVRLAHAAAVGASSSLFASASSTNTLAAIKIAEHCEFQQPPPNDRCKSKFGRGCSRPCNCSMSSSVRPTRLRDAALLARCARKEFPRLTKLTGTSAVGWCCVQDVPVYVDKRDAAAGLTGLNDAWALILLATLTSSAGVKSRKLISARPLMKELMRKRSARMLDMARIDDDKGNLRRERSESNN